jgi:colanic acid biosynthesis glycosyl transferase WcaI
MDALAEQVKKRGLDLSFCFVGHQDRELLRHSLGVPDLHWLSLRPALEGLIVPSKFYGIAAAGRPTLPSRRPMAKSPIWCVVINAGSASPRMRQ